MATVTHHGLTEAPRSRIEGVDFASKEAVELAEKLGLDAEDLEDFEGSGRNGAVTVRDVRRIAMED